MTTRKEHMQWCKKRALEYVNMGDLNQAVASMMSDLTKHPETDNPINAMLSMDALMKASRGDRAGVLYFINGFAK